MPYRLVMTTTDHPAALARPRLCYLEIPAGDVGRAAAFYEAVFGWKVRDRDGDRPSFTDAGGQVSGAWVRDRAVSAEPGLLPYIWVDDIDATLAAVAENGGEALDGPRLDVEPDGEWIATFRDPAGNVVGLYQEGPRRR
jgi:predicted enzyme related to lactoylglutathione lyase